MAPPGIAPAPALRQCVSRTPRQEHKMPDIPRLNPAIRALESGKPAFVTFSPAEIGAAQAIGAAL